MRKKILGWGLLAAFVLTAGAGLVLRQQFYGNAVVTERDLYVSARAEYGRSRTHCCRRSNTAGLSTPMPGGSTWPKPSSPGITCSNTA